MPGPVQQQPGAAAASPALRPRRSSARQKEASGASPRAGRSDLARYPRTGKRGAPQVFPRKLFEILDNESPEVIAWTDSGSSFAIKDMEVR